MEKQNIIFYSKYCTHCKNLLIKLKETNLLNLFDKKVCIDNMKNLPSFLKEVPTIIITDYDKPLEYDNALNWIAFKTRDQKKDERKDEVTLKAYDFNNGYYSSVDGSNLNTEQISLDNMHAPLLNNELQKKSEEAKSKIDTKMDFENIKNIRELDDTFNKGTPQY